MRHIPWLFLVLVAVLLVACGQIVPAVAVSTPESRPAAIETVAPTAVPVVPESRPAPVVVPTVSPEVLAARERLSHIGKSATQGLYIDHDFSLEEIIFGAEVIARVIYLRKQGSVVFNRLGGVTVGGWQARIEFRFRVHEYLKGTGPDEIGVFVYMDYDSEADARAALPTVLAAHDDRWDGREAVIFANATDTNGGIEDGFDISVGSGQFWFSDVGSVDRGFRDFYSVASETEKRWLPEATAATTTNLGRDTAASEKRFLLEVPTSDIAGTKSGGGTRSVGGATETITLSALKNQITALEREAAAGGTQDYRLCVEDAYRYQQWMRVRIAYNGDEVWDTREYTINSGLPAGTVLWEQDPRVGAAPNKTGVKWFAGPDSDLFGFEDSNFRASPYGTSTVFYTRRGVTARPLPAGVYRVYPNSQPEYSKLCTTDRSIGHNRRLDVVTVERTTAVPNIYHEAFFDPVAIGTAVGADGTNGVLKPASFAVGGVTTTISSLQSEGNAVTLVLNPHPTTLGDFTLDFIDTTGTTTLSLASSDAIGGTTWAVATSPWAAGDLLMLRIYKPYSKNADLSTLTLSDTGLAFDPSTASYAVSVPGTTTRTTVAPVLADPAASYAIALNSTAVPDGMVDLAVGDNVVTVTVTAEDGTTTRTYTVTVTRAQPPVPVTVTRIRRGEGILPHLTITIDWFDSVGCAAGRYWVAVYQNQGASPVARYGYHPVGATSLTQETNWLFDHTPDFHVRVTCDQGSEGEREVGRASIRAAQ